MPEAMKLLGVCRDTIRDHIASGRFSSHRREIEKWRPLLKRSEVLAYLDERRNKTILPSVASLRSITEEARLAVINRDGGRCVICKQKPVGKNCIVHHVIPRKGTDAAYDDHSVDNNVTLCPRCHAILHKAVAPRQRLTPIGETRGTLGMVERLLRGLNR